MKHSSVAFGLLAVFSFVLSSCEKIVEGYAPLEIFAEPMSGGAKVALDGPDATWEEGDPILFNGDTATVSRRDGHAYINVVARSVNRAVYPASMAASSLGSDNVTLRFPPFYHYRAADGHQLLELPMAARSEGGDDVVFRHLTGALYVTLTNTSGNTLTLQSLTVSSSKYQLSGTRNVDLSSIASFGAVQGEGADRSVAMLFDTGYVLAAGQSLKVMVPIMPVASDHCFSFVVNSYDGGSVFYKDTKSQPNSSVDHSLSRNQLGYAPMDVAAAGEGTFLEQQDNAYSIRTPLEFEMMAKAVDKGATADNSFTFNILDDIDMGGVTMSPITNGSLYSFVINGNNHTIRNLVINSVRDTPSVDYACGLFSKTSQLYIHDLEIDGLTLSHTASASGIALHMGGLSASCESGGGSVQISNCRVRYNSIVVADGVETMDFGGLVEDLSGVSSVVVSNCHVSMPSHTFSMPYSLCWGGLMGTISTGKDVNISSSSWSGTVSFDVAGNLRAGGLVGRDYRGNVSVAGCTVNGSMDILRTPGYQYVGSVIGQYNLVSPYTCTIDCDASGFVIRKEGETITTPQYSN